MQTTSKTHLSNSLAKNKLLLHYQNISFKKNILRRYLAKQTLNYLCGNESSH